MRTHMENGWWAYDVHYESYVFIITSPLICLLWPCGVKVNI